MIYFWARPEDCWVARYTHEAKNDMVDIAGDSYDEIKESPEAAALRGLGYRFHASWKHVVRTSPDVRPDEA